MIQANMLEAKTDLSKLVKLLETGEEDVIYIARNNVPVVQMTPVDLKAPSERIGIAKGRFTVPDEFDSWDDEVEKMFEALR